MPDISMCSNHKCPQRETCYRYRAIPNTPAQWYGLFIPVNGECKDHWPIEDRVNIYPMSEIEPNTREQ